MSDATVGDWVITLVDVPLYERLDDKTVQVLGVNPRSVGWRGRVVGIYFGPVVDVDFGLHKDVFGRMHQHEIAPEPVLDSLARLA